MKINWKIRLKNPVFVLQLVLSVLTPILGYMGLTLSDLTTWIVIGNALLGAVKNPYVLGLIAMSIFNCINDPTTSGFTDSARALGYAEPNRNK